MTSKIFGKRRNAMRGESNTCKRIWKGQCSSVTITRTTFGFKRNGDRSSFDCVHCRRNVNVSSGCIGREGSSARSGTDTKPTATIRVISQTKCHPLDILQTLRRLDGPTKCHPLYTLRTPRHVWILPLSKNDGAARIRTLLPTVHGRFLNPKKA